MTEEKKTDEAKVVDTKAKKTKAPNIERWWYTKGSEMRVICAGEPKGVVQFKNGIRDVNLDEEPHVAEALRKAQGYGSDLFVVVDADKASKEGKALSSQFIEIVGNVLDDNKNTGVRRVVQILTREELEKFGIDPLTVGKHELTALLYDKKSIAPIERA